MTSPTQRSKAYLVKAGYRVEIVEHWNAFARKRFDLFGFADLLALHDNPKVPLMFVQTTTAVNAASRRRKILDNPHARLLVRQGLEVVLHAWGKRGARGERKVWDPNAEWITLDMFEEAQP